MNKDIRQQRLTLLSEINRLVAGCDGCKTRAHFNTLGDPTGLSHACKACPLGQKISKYGEKLLAVTRPRKKIKKPKKVLTE